MPNKPTSLLDKAKAQEKKYDWISAADFYNDALSSVIDDFLMIAKLRERIGYCFLRAAFQADTNDEFKSRLNLSVESYEMSAKLYQKTNDNSKEATTFHAHAMVAYVSSLCTNIIPKKRKLLDKWFRLEKNVLNYYKKANDKFSIGKTCNNIAEKLFDIRVLQSNWEGIKKTILEELKYGEAAVAALSEVNDEFELARAYMLTSKSYFNGVYFKVVDNREEIQQKWKNSSKKSLELSEKIGDAYLISLANFNFASGRNVVTGGSIETLNYWRKGTKYAKIAKDKLLMGRGSTWTSFAISFNKSLEFDPDKLREAYKEALKLAQEGISYLSIIHDYAFRFQAYFSYVNITSFSESIEPKLKTKLILLEEAVRIGRENLKGIGQETIMFCTIQFHAFSHALFSLSKIETKLDKKLSLLNESLEWREKQLANMKQISPHDYIILGSSHNLHALIFTELAKNKTNEEKIKLLKKAVSAMEKCIEFSEKDNLNDSSQLISNFALANYRFGGILEKLYKQTKDKKILKKAIKSYEKAIQEFSKLEQKSRVAESYWQIARLKNHLGNNIDSANNYKLASKNYIIAAKKIPKLKEYYYNYSEYMQAWSEIEKAKHNHILEEYSKSRQHFKKAAKLHKSTEQWSYLTPNYLAWAKMEEAEDFSRKDETQQAIKAFQQAMNYFKKSGDSFQTKLQKITTTDEEEMIHNLFNSAKIRQKYCQARISIEDAKIFERNGKYNQSSRSYGIATEKLEQIIKKTEYKATINELKQLKTLSQAWQKMVQAEEKASPEIYLQASQLFEKAKDYSPTKRSTMLALGNSSFCKALAAGIKYQNTLDPSAHSKAKGHIKSAATYYLKAGFKAESEYAKATQRLFDAYLYLNNAEKETDPEKSAKYYQMAEKVLLISAESFMQAKYSEKKAEVQRILDTVKEEKELAFSLNEVLHAPSITSTTKVLTTSVPIKEESIDLERFEHANVQTVLVSDHKKVNVGESFGLSVEFMNVGKEPALLIKVEDFIPSEFIVVKKPEIYRIEETTLNMKGKQLAPLKLEEVELVVQPIKKGRYNLNPRLNYIDELGQNKSLQLNTIQIRVEEVVLADRISTGTHELDSLLLGGIPQGYAVALTGPIIDERDYLIKNFIDAGTRKNEITFHISTETDGLENLLEKPNFYLFLCNPKPKSSIPDLPNIFKLRSKTDLTNLSISLSKAYRNIEPSKKKRICIEIISDVLISHKADATRRWISELITDMGSKGFTILGVMDPSMHPSDQANAVINLFDGEIAITQTEDPLECKKSIRVKKLRNQDYIKNPLCLKKNY